MTEPVTRIPSSTPQFEASWEARACADALRHTTPGATISYDELCQASGGLDVQYRRRGILHTARAMVLREDALVFDAVRNVGLKRLTHAEVVALSEDRRNRIRRQAQKQLTHLKTVPYQDLPEEVRTKALAYAGLFVAVGAIVATRTLRFVEQHGTLPLIAPLTASQVQGLFR